MEATKVVDEEYEENFVEDKVKENITSSTIGNVNTSVHISQSKEELISISVTFLEWETIH
jgi:hypothetical protein